MPALDWVNFIIKELNKLTNVKLMKTELVGMFDHGVFGAIEKNKYKKIDQIFWKIT